jgi:hypothetical protein
MTLIYRLVLVENPELLDLPMSVATGPGVASGDMTAARDALATRCRFPLICAASWRCLARRSPH